MTVVEVTEAVLPRLLLDAEVVRCERLNVSVSVSVNGVEKLVMGAVALVLWLSAGVPFDVRVVWVVLTGVPLEGV
jgi:hypothetical protein